MKKYLIYFCLSVTFFTLGIGFFLLKRNWIILHWVPGYNLSEDVSGVLGKKIAPKRTVALYYWKEGSLKKELVSFVWLSSKAESLKLLVGNWLTFVYEERILGKKVGVDSVALSISEQEVYISFDQILFLREWSIHRKWQLLDSLCRTISASGLGIAKLIFLVGHESMVDDHLDFSQPWPVDGFG